MYIPFGAISFWIHSIAILLKKLFVILRATAKLIKLKLVYAP
jgi:hypothetical protein